MDLYELSFGKVIILNDHLAEVIVDEHIDMNLQMVEEYHEFLLQNLKAPFSLLINKINNYSYTPDAMPLIADLKEIEKMAVVDYHRMSAKFATETLKSGFHPEWNLKIFHDRESALNWLS